MIIYSCHIDLQHCHLTPLVTGKLGTRIYNEFVDSTNSLTTRGTHRYVSYMGIKLYVALYGFII